MNRTSKRESLQNHPMEEWGRWLQQAVAGDSKIYSQLLEEISKVLKLYFQKRISHTDKVEDLVQEVLLGVHKAKHTYDTQRPFSAWLFAIARYKTIDYFRKQKREPDWIQFESFGEDYFEAELFHDEKLENLLKSAVNQLPKQQKEIFIRLKFEGDSIKDVAQKMNSSESAIKVNAHRAYKNIQKWLSENGRGL